MSLNSISRWFVGRGRQRGPRRVPPARLGLERLECRDVPTGFTGGLSNGVLTINGTAGADKISLLQTGNTVRLEGYTNTWSAGAISQIRINAGGGNDTVRVEVSKHLAATLAADGGAGHDVLYTTAQPKSWTGFEAGHLIAPPAGTAPAPATGARVEWTGTAGPFTVSFYRRGDGSNGANGGELDGVYSTRQAAENAVAKLQQWAGRINNGGYWDVVRITVEGAGTSGGSTNTFTTAFENTFREIADRYHQLVARRNEIVNRINAVVARYRPYHTLYQNAIRLRDSVNQLFNTMTMTVRDVYNRYGQQPNLVWANPSVLTFAAQQLRQQADRARDYVNRNLSGDVWAPARNAALSALQIVYDAANRMNNLAGEIRRARGI